MKMTNHWNQIIYRLWAPIYDSTVNRFFMSGRKRALELLHLQPGERVLIVGVGTGADLPLLPAGVNATGIDLSPDMLAKARLKLPACRATVELIQGDAQVLLMPEDSCDAAILNLILSVVPDSRACLQSTLRAVKPGGRLVVFDKFQPDGEKVTPGRRFMNFFSTRLGTDITRRFGGMLAGCSCKILHDEPSLLGGMYRVILLRKE
ncbi:MAG TPA: methyltransferase domain-containing protein [Anaerolineales bacterium]|nr:methyltransferase domain-containing protein [Anaerolineales bacterium]